MINLLLFCILPKCFVKSVFYGRHVAGMFPYTGPKWILRREPPHCRPPCAWTTVHFTHSSVMYPPYSAAFAPMEPQELVGEVVLPRLVRMDKFIDHPVIQKLWETDGESLVYSDFELRKDCSPILLMYNTTVPSASTNDYMEEFPFNKTDWRYSERNNFIKIWNGISLKYLSYFLGVGSLIYL